MEDRHIQKSYPLRISAEMRKELEAAAKESGRSLHSEIVARLESSFSTKSPEETLAALTRLERRLTDAEMEAFEWQSRAIRQALALEWASKLIPEEILEKRKEDAELFEDLQLEAEITLNQEIPNRPSDIREALDMYWSIISARLDAIEGRQPK